MLKHDNVLEMYVTAVRGRDANSIVTRRLIIIMARRLSVDRPR